MWTTLLLTVASWAADDGWTRPKPFVQPILGAGFVTVNGVGVGQVTGGATAGFVTRYKAKPVSWVDTTRAQLTGTVGLPTWSMGADARVGSFIGPSVGPLLVQAGPDVSFNGYGRLGAEDYWLPWAPGIGIPVQARLIVAPSALTIRGDVVPGWVFAAARQSGLVDPLHELTAGASAALNAGPIGFTIGYRRFWNAAGAYDLLSFGAAL